MNGGAGNQRRQFNPGRTRLPVPGRVTPHVGTRASGIMFRPMKTKQKNEMTLDDLITTAYQIWGSDRAEKMVRMAINTRLVTFRQTPHFLHSNSKSWYV